jgi:hypothetical protein
MRQTVKAGKHDFRPNALPIPYNGDFTRVLKVDFTPSCWYEKYSFDCGKSWNKAGGFTAYWSRNNVNSLLLAWRPSEGFGHFEVCLYANDAKGGWKATAPLTMREDETAAAIFTRRGSGLSVRLEIWKGTEKVQEGKSEIVSTIPGSLRVVGAWFGGQCPAPEDMELWTGWSKVQ